MIERRTLLDVIGDGQQSRATNTAIGQKLLPVLDEPSEVVVSSFLEGIERASSTLMDGIKDRISAFLQNDLRELTGQDIVIELLFLESQLEDVNRTISALKTEADLVKMSYNDAYNAEYQHLLEGTVNDRNAFAEGKTTKERYLSYAKTALYEALEKRAASLRRQVSLIEKLLWQGIREA